eukprot:3492048-Rhodomonas_salina.1
MPRGQRLRVSGAQATSLRRTRGRSLRRCGPRTAASCPRPTRWASTTPRSARPLTLARQASRGEASAATSPPTAAEMSFGVVDP